MASYEIVKDSIVQISPTKTALRVEWKKADGVKKLEQYYEVEAVEQEEIERILDETLAEWDGKN